MFNYTISQLIISQFVIFSGIYFSARLVKTNAPVKNMFFVAFPFMFLLLTSTEALGDCMFDMDLIVKFIQISSISALGLSIVYYILKRFSK